MKIYLTRCSTCNDPNNPLNIVELTDENVYQTKCSRGHIATTLILLQKFEILFEMGAVALIDGYHREAVSNFASSLERFLEFYIDVMLIEEGVTHDEFKKSWKLVANQSERQLGAFVFLYLTKNKQSVTYLSDKAINFRNKVIHKGYIPTFDETCDYGQAVLSFVDPILNDLKVNHARGVHDLLTRQARRPEGLTSSFVFPTIISFSYGHSRDDKEGIVVPTNRDFRTELESLRKKINDLTSGKPAYGIFGNS